MFITTFFSLCQAKLSLQHVTYFTYVIPKDEPSIFEDFSLIVAHDVSVYNKGDFTIEKAISNQQKLQTTDIQKKTAKSPS
jgi:hypothetical protein